LRYVFQVELAHLSLKRRIGAMLNILDDYPSLAVEQRLELLEAALWPRVATLPDARPQPTRVRTSPRERSRAVDMVTRLHMSVEEVASRYDVTPATVRYWVRRATL